MLKYSKNKSHFDKYGFCVIDSFFNHTELKNLNKKVKSFIQKKSKVLKGKNINFTKNKTINTMHDVNKFEKYFKKFALKKKKLRFSKFFFRLHTSI